MLLSSQSNLYKTVELIPAMKSDMNRPLTACISAIVLTAVIEVALAGVENEIFQFCTTKAYGWPTPWKMDYCPCEGAVTTYPKIHWIVNFSSVFGSGLAAFLLVRGIARPLPAGTPDSNADRIE